MNRLVVLLLFHFGSFCWVIPLKLHVSTSFMQFIVGSSWFLVHKACCLIYALYHVVCWALQSCPYIIYAEPHQIDGACAHTVSLPLFSSIIFALYWVSLLCCYLAVLSTFDMRVDDRVQKCGFSYHLWRNPFLYLENHLLWSGIDFPGWLMLATSCNNTIYHKYQIHHSVSLFFTICFMKYPDFMGEPCLVMWNTKLISLKEFYHAFFSDLVCFWEEKENTVY